MPLELLRLLAELGAAAACAWIVTAAGRRLRRGLRCRGPAEELGIDLALGLAAWGSLLFVFGLLGWIARGPVWTLLLVSVALSARECGEVGGALRALALGSGPRRNRRWWLERLPFVAVLFPMAWLAAFPPTGFDSLNYHLPYVAGFVDSGRLVTLETLRFPVFPQLVELVLTVPFLLGGEIAAEAFLLAPALGVAALVGSWAARLGGRASGPWAAAIWLGGPLVVWISSQAYVDLALSLLVVAAFVCLDIACLETACLDPGRGAASGRRALAGVFLGAACATKYLGVPWLALGVLVAAGRRSAPRERLRAAALVAAVGLAVAAPWYLRILAETGSPVFPYLSGVFGGEGGEWLGEDDRADPASPEEPARREGDRGSGLRGGVLGVLALPLTAGWVPTLFDRQAPHTPWAFPLLVAVAWAARRDRRLRWLLGPALAFGPVLLLHEWIDLRFVLPAAALLSAAGGVALRGVVAWALRGARDRRVPIRRPGLAELAVTFALLAPGAAYGVFKSVERGVPPLSAAEHDAYLARWVPGYLAVEHLDAGHGASYTVYALGYERARFHAQGRFLGDWYGRYRFSLVERAASDPAATHALLRSWGVGHLMTSRGFARGWSGAGHSCFAEAYRDAQTVVYRLADTGVRGCSDPDRARAPGLAAGRRSGQHRPLILRAGR